MSRIAKSKNQMREESRKGRKEPKSRLPEPKKLRIMQRHVTGESNRKIAHTEEVDRKTVARVVRSQEFQDLIRQERERFYALVPDAVDTVQHVLREKKDARIAYQVLPDTGVIPSAEEKSSAPTQPPQSLSDEARETLLASMSGVDRQIFQILKMFRAKMEAYGLSPDIELPEKMTPLPDELYRRSSDAPKDATPST